jgi:hypothetical protein
LTIKNKEPAFFEPFQEMNQLLVVEDGVLVMTHIEIHLSSIWYISINLIDDYCIGESSMWLGQFLFALTELKFCL